MKYQKPKSLTLFIRNLTRPACLAFSLLVLGSFFIHCGPEGPEGPRGSQGSDGDSNEANGEVPVCSISEKVGPPGAKTTHTTKVKKASFYTFKKGYFFSISEYTLSTGSTGAKYHRLIQLPNVVAGTVVTFTDLDPRYVHSRGSSEHVVYQKVHCPLSQDEKAGSYSEGEHPVFTSDHYSFASSAVGVDPPTYTYTFGGTGNTGLVSGETYFIFASPSLASVHGTVLRNNL